MWGKSCNKAGFICIFGAAHVCTVSLPRHRANGVIVVLRDLGTFAQTRLTLCYVPDCKVTVLKRLSGWQPDPPWLSLGDACLTKHRFIQYFQAFPTSLICDVFLL